jgi:hypothetical protein
MQNYYSQMEKLAGVEMTSSSNIIYRYWYGTYLQFKDAGSGVLIDNQMQVMYFSIQISNGSWLLIYPLVNSRSNISTYSKNPSRVFHYFLII